MGNRALIIGLTKMDHTTNSRGERYGARLRGIDGQKERAIASVRDTRPEAILDCVRYMVDADVDFSAAVAEVSDVAAAQDNAKHRERTKTVKRLLSDVLPSASELDGITALAEKTVSYIHALRAELDSVSGAGPVVSRCADTSDANTIMALQTQIDRLTAENEELKQGVDDVLGLATQAVQDFQFDAAILEGVAMAGLTPDVQDDVDDTQVAAALRGIEDQKSLHKIHLFLDLYNAHEIGGGMAEVFGSDAFLEAIGSVVYDGMQVGSNDPSVPAQEFLDAMIENGDSANIRSALIAVLSVCKS